MIASGNDPAPAHLEHQEQDGEIDHAGRNESEPVYDQDVEDIDADDQREREQMAW